MQTAAINRESPDSRFVHFSRTTATPLATAMWLFCFSAPDTMRNGDVVKHVRFNTGTGTVKNLIPIATQLLACLAASGPLSAEPVVLNPADYARYVARFNANDLEDVVNLIPDANAWDWIQDHAPLFECPSSVIEEAYYFRWWTYRKHIKQTPDGLVLTEFILPVSHAGAHNTISCAFGHHVAEGRWLRDQQLLDEYARYWFRSGDDGGPAPHFHKFSSWAPAALYERYLVTGEQGFLLDLLDDLVADYRTWEGERQRSDGLFWQHDVKDGMEESISGGRRVKNVRPTINSYMTANAKAIAHIATLGGRTELAREFSAKANSLHQKAIDYLWDADAEFFKVRLENGDFSAAREAIGFIPWAFHLARPEHAIAWRQLNDREGFGAPAGMTTAERRHPEFRTHGTGTCEWDGAVWPFATSQTLTGLANLLQETDQPFVTKRDFFEQLLIYARAHQRDGKPYIGEYHDEVTGKWLITGKKAARSRFYNHSTFNDLVIRGIAGIVPRADNVLEIDPL
ncbi:hypothetical protein OAS39_13725, partial [Pirellulales bacterium]|nr:hypothetical protein [Pirellulales bacterium]